MNILTVEFQYSNVRFADKYKKIQKLKIYRFMFKFSDISFH